MLSGSPMLRRLSSLRGLLLPSPSLAPHHQLAPLPPFDLVSSASAAARARCRRRPTPGSPLRAALEDPVGEFPSAVNERFPSGSGPNQQVPRSGSEMELNLRADPAFSDLRHSDFLIIVGGACFAGQKNGSQMRFIGNGVKYFDVLWNPLDQRYVNAPFNGKPNALHRRCMLIHTGQQLNVMDHDTVAPPKCSGDIPSSSNGNELKPKRKKLKGKRAVVRWLKFFRWKKEKEYERMTAEEKILYKLKKSAQNAGIQHCNWCRFEEVGEENSTKKETRLVEALKKIEPLDSSETIHDPEILTPEEHFYLLKMGHKCKNYVPIGRRGIFQGVILNMHLHWKKHQTLKVIVKTFTPEEVREIAAELARLSGGIVLDIHEEDTIIMYRGKNYMQPPTEIMSPRITLSRKKALDKSKYRDALRAVRKYIPRLEQDLELLHVQAKDGKECRASTAAEEATPESVANREIFGTQLETLLRSQEENGNADCSENYPTESDALSDSEALSDMFDTDSDGESSEKVEQALYLDTFELFPPKVDGRHQDFEEHLRQIPAASECGDSSGKDIPLSELDEIDRMFLQAGSLLKKTR
ncbi:hypothetical protein Taro_031046 [Colocasia esculenta]|uniref:CRM domain-containing protein n=1 Tax=Colocasia esculenta TaxID=4460 RepID=A0A843VQT6_COLES|nr:hypothetical protein [Colocasia esculenta]